MGEWIAASASAGSAPRIGPTYGMTSVAIAQSPRISAYWSPSGQTPVSERISTPMPELAPIRSETVAWPRT